MEKVNRGKQGLPFDADFPNVETEIPCKTGAGLRWRAMARVDQIELRRGVASLRWSRNTHLHCSSDFVELQCRWVFRRQARAARSIRRERPHPEGTRVVKIEGHHSSVSGVVILEKIECRDVFTRDPSNGTGGNEFVKIVGSTTVELELQLATIKAACATRKAALPPSISTSGCIEHQFTLANDCLN
ncbi:hypothetical protein C8R47DRAFT_1068161 [Mycena vitilis]|nr:hypothetical protein C8R47DRAFT_1068161 [Mycena vitilis]